MIKNILKNWYQSSWLVKHSIEWCIFAWVGEVKSSSTVCMNLTCGDEGPLRAIEGAQALEGAIGTNWYLSAASASDPSMKGGGVHIFPRPPDCQNLDGGLSLVQVARV